ncbi:MAG: hypothetical protein CSA32_03755 [Desulfobulbus propionicus]|nr:MAG: hypothetical protein CSA32_03755 [Desulfobulbus propionicus]
MYLARQIIHDRIHYILRHSVRSGDRYVAEDILDLGPDPSRYILYTGDVSYELDERILHALEPLGISSDSPELEELFLPYLDPYIRIRTEPFRNRHAYRNWRPMTEDAKAEVLAKTHVFDRRRVHFLRFGHSSPEILDNSPPLYKILLEKSRDEIEQYITAQEGILQPHEYRRYLFTIFDLQRHFSSGFARLMADALDQHEVDERFIEEYCRLDRDALFWKGFARSRRAPYYLLRYLFMYFDLALEGNDFLWNTMNRGYRRRRAYRPPAPGSRHMSISEAVAVIGVSREQFAGMSKQELTSLYRKKAQRAHPDKGGRHEDFVQLNEAYNELRRVVRS